MSLALGGEDAAWLHMESPASPMHVGALVELGGPLARAALVERIEQRLLGDARFRSRVVEPLAHVGPPHWEKLPDFDARSHVDHLIFDADTWSTSSLRELVSRRMSETLDRDEPLWRVTLLDRLGGSSALFLRVHHAVADGFAMLAALLGLCDEGLDGTAALAARDHGRRLADFAAATARVVGLPPDPRTVVRGPLGAVKRVAWTAPLPLADLKAIAKPLGATLNDVLVAAVSDALRRFLERRGEEPVSLRAMVPVNLRKAPLADAHGNRFGLVLLDLPVGEHDARARVKEVRLAMRELKANAEASVTYGILWSMGLGPQSIERVGTTFFGKKASLVVTNVAGPRERLHIAGVPIRDAVFWVPQAAGIGLGISIFSYAGSVTIGVLADSGLVPDPEELVRGIEASLAELA